MKQLLVRFKGFSEKDREVWGYASRPEIDREDEVILTEAWRHPDSLSDFMRNPILCAFHDYRQLPLGRVIELESRDEGLFFRAEFADTEAAKEAFQFIVSTEGVASFSVGFIGIESKMITVRTLKTMGVDTKDHPANEKIKSYTHVQLLEISLVPIPASMGSTALGNAFRAGAVQTKGLQQARESYIVIVDEPELEIEDEEKQAEQVDQALIDKAKRELDLRGIISESLKDLRGKLVASEAKPPESDTGEPEFEVNAEELSSAIKEVTGEKLKEILGDIDIDRIFRSGDLGKVITKEIKDSIAIMQGKLVEED